MSVKKGNEPETPIVLCSRTSTIFGLARNAWQIGCKTGLERSSFHRQFVVIATLGANELCNTA